MTTISIVIPVYNSETTIEPLCEHLLQELSSSWRLQIVLVDDGSSDGSADICQRLHERYPESISFIMLSKNFGEHNAVMAGLNYADGEYCVIMDDDFQNPPSEVRHLINEISHGYDVVYVRYDNKQHHAMRNLMSWMHNRMATHALGKPSDLYLSSFKIMSRFLVREVIQYTGPDPYLDAIILRTTRNIGTIPARHEPRQQGESGYTVGKLVTLWGNMMVAFSLYPLRIVGGFGFVMAIVGMLFGFYTYVAWMIPGLQEPDDFEKLNASMWFFRGSTMLAISIIGEYVGRIYMLLNRSPQFIIRQAMACRPENPFNRSYLQSVPRKRSTPQAQAAVH